MTASEASFVGFAKQAAKGTIMSVDANFNYVLFTEGSMAPNSIFLPLDMEVGGGALVRSLAKVGVTSAGAFTFIPRPLSLGWMLLGALGDADAAVQQGATAAYLHAFHLPTDQFDAPYFTFRSKPGGMWGETFLDCRVAALSLTWRAADFMRANLAVLGGTPTPNVSTASWSESTYVDGGPQFLAPVFDIELPTATDIKVLSGAFTMGMNIPLDEQWITGAYEPDDFEINSRVFTLSMTVKITDESLYEKMSYDPAGTATAWVAEVYKEADFKLLFNSDTLADTGYPYSLQIEANGDNQASGTANVAWSVTPIALRAGRQVTLNVTGTWLADPGAGEPITVSLINTKATDYA
jgi:hypothetical protein